MYVVVSGKVLCVDVVMRLRDNMVRWRGDNMCFGGGRLLTLVVAVGELGGVVPRPWLSQKQLVIEHWLSRASSTSSWSASSGGRFRFAGFGTGDLLAWLIARLFSTQLLLGRKVASSLTVFLLDSLSMSVHTRL